MKVLPLEESADFEADLEKDLGDGGLGSINPSRGYWWEEKRQEGVGNHPPLKVDEEKD